MFEENWTHPPFGAEIDDKGRIFARGTQDMKSVGAQHLAAVRALQKQGVKQLKRTVHIVFVPGELHYFIIRKRIKMYVCIYEIKMKSWAAKWE